MNKPTQYQISTVADLFRVVDTHNMKALLADMRGMFLNALLTKALFPCIPGHEDDDLFAGAKFTWTDDGINEQVITATAEDGRELCFKTSGANVQPTP